MKVLAIVNPKGGVGKTTLSTTLLQLMPLNGLRVLGIDLDPQANLSFTLLKRVLTDEDITSYDLLVYGKFVPVTFEGFDFIPSALQLANAEYELLSAPAREYRLQRALREVVTRYDLIIVDTPPNLGTITLNALMAADGLLIPVETRFYGLIGLKNLFDIIADLKEYAGKTVEIVGIVPNFFERNVNLQKEVLEQLKSLNYKVFAPIPKRSGFQYVASTGDMVADRIQDKDTQEALETLIQEVLEWAKRA